MKWMIGLMASGMLLVASGCQLVTVPVTAAYDVSNKVAVGGSAQPHLIYSNQDLVQLNAQMEAAGVPVTLAETYEYGYRRRFPESMKKGSTGQLAGDVQTANTYFHRILAANNVADADKYLLTMIETAQQEGFTLFAVVYRPREIIRVKKKLDPSIIITVKPREEDYYLPYRSEADGKRLDVVYDWAAIPNDCFATQAQQALLLTLVANEVIEQEAAPDYWAVEEQWLAGDYMTAVMKQDRAVCGKLNLEEGATMRPSGAKP